MASMSKRGMSFARKHNNSLSLTISKYRLFQYIDDRKYRHEVNQGRWYEQNSLGDDSSYFC